MRGARFISGQASKDDVSEALREGPPEMAWRDCRKLWRVARLYGVHGRVLVALAEMAVVGESKLWGK